ncbi:glycosyl hydrolase family 10 protein [Puccinia sorghi]|uniref:endo-1,4-beta-xylanase n=1 Tax=Puccinia sorghi TaxID=27349 RepID=A0A0L6V3D3_9BASI|nr:glycosyl hydrolase family 10 protein [Puccinia sorghi]
MKSTGLRVMFCFFFNFSQVWLASAAPQEGSPGKDSFKPGPNTSGAGSQDKPLMGVGIGADGLQNPKSSQVIQKYFQSLFWAICGDLWKAILANITLDLRSSSCLPQFFMLQKLTKPSGYDAKNIKPCSTQIFEYAKKNNKLLRIHTMFARGQHPVWIDQLKKEDLQKAMTNILEQVVRRYASRAIGIDVCNEILNDQGNLDDNPWKKTLGDSWVDFAYTVAKRFRDRHNKNMLLFSNFLLFFLDKLCLCLLEFICAFFSVNDFRIESKNPKSDGMLKLATRLNKAGLLDAVGFQCHFTVGQVPKDLKENLERFTAAGLKVALTEVDVRIQLNGQQTASPQDQDTQARDYQTIYETCKQVKGCVSVTTWGLTPKDSWIGKYGFSPGFGDATLFNNDFTPNKAMQKIQGEFFAQATR